MLPNLQVHPIAVELSYREPQGCLHCEQRVQPSPLPNSCNTKSLSTNTSTLGQLWCPSVAAEMLYSSTQARCKESTIIISLINTGRDAAFPLTWTLLRHPWNTPVLRAGKISHLSSHLSPVLNFWMAQLEFSTGYSCLEHLVSDIPRLLVWLHSWTSYFFYLGLQ